MIFIYYVLRGGGCYYAAKGVRSAQRGRVGPGSVDNGVGFRLARTRNTLHSYPVTLGGSKTGEITMKLIKINQDIKDILDLLNKEEK